MLFAELREAAGRGELELDLPQGSTVGELLAAIREAHPALAGYLPRVQVALARRLADPAAELQPGAEVALIPPVGGG